MNHKLSFRERAALGMIRLAKQLPVTLEEARRQAQWLRENSKVKEKNRKEIH